MADLPQKLVNKTYLVTGAAGFVAKELIPYLLAEGALVFGLVHTSVPDFPASKQLHMVKTIAELAAVLGELKLGDQYIDGVIHLAGAGIGDWPWTKDRKQVLQASRWDLIDQLHQQLRQCHIQVGRILGASAIGFYGHTGDHLIEESAAKGRGFAAHLCEGVEQRLSEAAQLQSLVADTSIKENELDLQQSQTHATPATPWYALRIGVVIGPEGGVLAKLQLSHKLGLGAILGSGQQWLSWIDRRDLVNAIVFLLHHDVASGAVNLTAPNPVRWRDFSHSLSGVFGRKTRIKVPAMALAPLGEMKSLFLDSVRVMPAVLLKAGFQFKHDHLTQSLAYNVAAKAAVDLEAPAKAQHQQPVKKSAK